VPRWIVTGAEGQLGSALVRLLRGRGEVVHGLGRDADVTDEDALAAGLARVRAGPGSVCVNAAAFTHVDRCESEPRTAELVNARAPAALARLCRDADAFLVHVSTDYVFDGEARRPYTEADVPAPRSTYGRTKLAGEQAVLAIAPAVLVVRTSWVYGRGRNFVGAVLRQAAAGRPLRVVDDQVGRPTAAVDLAAGLVRLVEAGCAGLYHLAGRGTASWWDVARAVLDHVGLEGLAVERIRTDDLDLPAPRPRYSVLDCAKAEQAGATCRPWREALADYLESEDVPAERWRLPGGHGGARGG
jgi:dTDP-4-dehydrorhamnose reductase